MRTIVRTGTQIAVATALLISCLLVQPQHAVADIGDPVQCADPSSENPYCDLEAANDPVYTDEGGGEVVCRQNGEVVPCVTEDGWLGGDGCRYLRVDGAEPPTGTEGPGAGYRVTCPGDPPGAQRPLEWLPDGQAPGVVQLAQVAVSRLRLPSPQVELSPPPPAPQLVQLPTWLRVSNWEAGSASASVPGVTVTATASPTMVRWRTGDGGSVTCNGAGTRWTPDIDPRAESPSCGYTYTSSSQAQPGGTFRLEATITWQVSWTGGSSSGTMAPLTTSSVTPVAVAESLSRNTGGSRE